MNKTVSIAAIVLIAGAALTGCSTIKDVVDVATPIVDAVNEQDTWITVGDCFDETAEDIVTDVPTIDCALPHDYEVYASIQLDKAVWPGDDEIFALADEACLAPFVFASHAYESFHLVMPLFLCRRWTGTVQARVHGALAWVRPERLTDYPMPPADAPLVAWLRDLL